MRLKSRDTVLFGLAAAFWVALAFSSAAGRSVEEDSNAPDFTLQALDGKKISLSQYRGKYVVVNFWATWCGPCKVEMPSLEKLYQRFKSRKFELLAISGDMFGARVVRPFVEAQNLSFTILLDQRLAVSQQYGVVSLPTTFLIDPEGKVAGIHHGADDWSDPEVLRFFENLLKTS